MTNIYSNPLSRRYSSIEMRNIFSDDEKFSIWRRLWVALAESQKELGLPITDEQLDEMRNHITDINYDAAEDFERETNHDVVAHIYAYGRQCPKARPIIHLGATSSYVCDNTDILLQRSALRLVKKRLIDVVSKLCCFANKYKDMPCLSYTHLQAAQPTTVGKRATLWIQDLLFDLEYLEFILMNLRLLGCKGATGTSASFLSLFNGDYSKVKALEQRIAEKMGFCSVYAVSGQTYSRKLDHYMLSALSGIAQSAYKFSNDIRFLSHLKEIEEPFEVNQVGSSAMAYKRNPILSERIASLSRYVMVDALNPALTASSQWLERTLDDSANRRISIPEAFLATDSIISLYAKIASEMTVYPNIIKKHLDEEMPFIMTENIVLHCVKKGGDRQELLAKIRAHTAIVIENIKLRGLENDLITRILHDNTFDLSEKEIANLVNVENFSGMAKEQTEDFLLNVLAIVEANKVV